MKSSLKFREDQKPLFRAKVPLSILGLPFQSGLAAGDSKELCLSLATLFDSGPAFRVAYRPNDSNKPFSLVLKTGIGAFGSPLDAPMTMSAEFNLVGGSHSSSTAFFLHFKPQFGDFSVRKSQSSTEFAHRLDSKRSAGDASSEDEGSVEVVDPPLIGGDYLSVGGGGGGRLTELAARSSSSVAAVVDTALAGMELGARTVLPIRNGAVLKLRWGVRFPDDFRTLFTKQGIGLDPTAGISSRGIPLLVMNKIGIEHVAKEDSKDQSKVGGGSLHSDRIADVADTCLAVRRQMVGLQAETGRMGKAMDDFRSEFTNRGLNNSANGTGRVYGGGERKLPPPQAGGDHVGDEPKKAMKGTTAP